MTKLGVYWKALIAAVAPLFVVFNELIQDGAMSKEDWTYFVVTALVAAGVWGKANTVNGQNVATTPAHVQPPTGEVL